MPIYMKAVLVGDLKRFPGWPDALGDDGEALSDDTVLYLHEDLRVTREPDSSAGALFERASSDWSDFCRQELEFQVPDWESESARVREQLREKAL